MNNDITKKNSPELLTDWNGNPVQCWGLGGRTIEASGSFVCESTLMRLCNIGSSPATVKLKGVEWDKIVKDGADEGMPVLPNTAMVVSVPRIGMEFEVEGTLYVTFCYDRRATLEGCSPQYPDFQPSSLSPEILGNEEGSYEDGTLSYSGIIPRGADANYIAFELKSDMDMEKFPDAFIKVEAAGQVRPNLHTIRKLITEQGTLDSIYVQVKGLPFIASVFVSWVPGNPAYEERFEISIPKEEGTFLQIG